MDINETIMQTWGTKETKFYCQLAPTCIYVWSVCIMYLLIKKGTVSSIVSKTD